MMGFDRISAAMASMAGTFVFHPGERDEETETGGRAS